MASSLDQAREKLEAHLSSAGLKHTRQRDTILEIFLSMSGHPTSEQVYREVQKRSPEVGAATVYRALKLFIEAEIATASHFHDGVTVYEHQLAHHDHMICLRCHKVIEFEDEVVEERQATVARDHGFTLVRHRHDLYGYCPDCQ